MTARETLDRRSLLVGTGSVALLLAVDAAPAAAQELPNGWEDVLKKIVGEAKPSEGKLALELPEIAENGNTVPFSVSIDSPMTEQEFVKAVHVLSTGNPQPVIVSMYFTPLAGKATVAGRMRLARTQDIITLAELSDGRFLTTKRSVKVTIGGCGG